MSCAVDVERFGQFRLPEDFCERYRLRDVPWGFGALSWATYLRTYSRDGERWFQTCRRVIEGTLTIWRCHCLLHDLPWDAGAADAFAQEAYDRLFRLLWSPPGRGLWIMGTRFCYERGGAALNNCGFISTADVDRDYAAPFLWMMRMSMVGVGVGFDTRGRDRVEIRPARRGDDTHMIADSREGWADALGRVLNAYAADGSLPARWDYSRIRPAGTRLESFGGFASGPEPLRDMLESLQTLYDSRAGRRADSTLIVDTMNLIGRCVVAGGIRRSAQIAFGDPGDGEFLDLKQDAEKVRQYRWVSNNSIFAQVGMDYGPAARRTADNGEPGYFWLDNARAFGRLADGPDWRDEAAAGSNPCAEQTLWDRELCTLVETFPARHESLDDFLRTLHVAYTYAKIVTLVPTGEPATDAVMARNRRIGCSMTGIVQAVNRLGLRTFLDWCDRGYDRIRHLDDEASDRLRVPRSIKLTSVKPSGTVSLLAGASAGVHWPFAPYYVRRVRVAESHPLANLCRKAGYQVEPDAYSANTAVVSFPVHVPHLLRGRDEVGLWEKIDLAAQLQHCWSDNQVSCTADFDPATEGHLLPRVLEAYEKRLKAIVFLPSRGHGYAQPPYERIMREHTAVQDNRGIVDRRAFRG